MTSPPPTANAVHWACQAQHNSQEQTHSEAVIEAFPLLLAGHSITSGFKRPKHTMTFHFWPLSYVTRKRDGLMASQQIQHCLLVCGGTGSMRDLLLLRNLLHMKQAWYFRAERQGPGLQSIWGCQWLLLPHRFIVLQGRRDIYHHWFSWRLKLVSK